MIFCILKGHGVCDIYFRKSTVSRNSSKESPVNIFRRSDREKEA